MPKLQCSERKTGEQYTLTIPQAIVDRHGWKPGDTIDIVNSGVVVILQKREESKKK